MKFYKKAFTLIELLIVIALLGALAVGLLAALDPFEQLKKGTDTGVRNTVSEFHGAVIRYYAIKNIMPWCSASDCTTYRDTLTTQGSETPYGNALSSFTNTIVEIASAGELKSNFSNLAGSGTLAKIFVTGDNTAATVKVCYLPTAKSFINDPNTRYTKYGVEQAAGTCKGQGGTATDCYWCVQ